MKIRTNQSSIFIWVKAQLHIGKENIYKLKIASKIFQAK